LPENQAIVRFGAVAVIAQQGKLLVIRRSQHVVAPGYFCFPGGGLEPGETETEALVRELREELNCEITPTRRLWENVSRWRIHLAWWQATLVEGTSVVPNPLEVETVHWLTPAEIASLPNVLDGNREFVGSLLRGEIPLDLD
jgi:8-oxo-dGTP pyrophosphatase MutT (NUDIX family)